MHDISKFDKISPSSLFLGHMKYSSFITPNLLLLKTYCLFQHLKVSWDFPTQQNVSWSLWVKSKIPKCWWRRTQGKGRALLRIRPQEIAMGKQAFLSQPETNIFLVQVIKPTVVSLAAAKIPKPPVEAYIGGIGLGSPTRVYFLYLQGFLQPVLAEMTLTDPNNKLLYCCSSSLE